MKIFTYAFANTSFFFNEVIKSSQQENNFIEWGIIYPRANYKNSSNTIVATENIFYLYENFDDTYSNISHSDIAFDFSNECDNIFKILKSSKLAYQEEFSDIQLKSAYAIYKRYKTFLLTNKPDYIIFPDLEVIDGLILLNLCKELDIGIMHCVHTRLFGKSIFASDYYDTLPVYYGTYTQEDYNNAYNLLRGETKAFNNTLPHDVQIKIKLDNIITRSIKNIYHSLKYEKNLIEKPSFTLKIKMNLPLFIQVYRKYFYTFVQKSFFHIKKDIDQLPANYILFPLQVTPESSINTLEQYFVEQERVIDLIVLNMPQNFYLLVKEHPSMIGKRNNRFYKKLQKKAGVILVAIEPSTKKLIEKSKLVVTITGTVGLECYLNDKPAIMFGPTFFKHLTTRFDSYLNLKSLLFNRIFNYKPSSHEEKIQEVAKLLNIGYDFIVHEPLHFPMVMQKNNIANFLDAVKIHITRSSSK